MLTFHQCCRIVLQECKDGYAKAYAERGMSMFDGSEMARRQCAYILGNIGHWRGGRSKEVRARLKELSKKDLENLLSEHDLDKARKLIRSCEEDLRRPLKRGECSDLLADNNAEWSLSSIKILLDRLGR